MKHYLFFYLIFLFSFFKTINCSLFTYKKPDDSYCVTQGATPFKEGDIVTTRDKNNTEIQARIVNPNYHPPLFCLEDNKNLIELSVYSDNTKTYIAFFVLCEIIINNNQKQNTNSAPTASNSSNKSPDNETSSTTFSSMPPPQSRSSSSLPTQPSSSSSFSTAQTNSSSRRSGLNRASTLQDFSNK